MDIQITDSAKIALRTLNPRDRERMEGLFASLENWENDPHIRKMSRQLDDQNTYVLTATDGTRIFFNKDGDTILILDLASKRTVDKFVEAE